MEDIIYLFENITSIQRSIILVGGITFFWSIESIIPLFNFNYKKLRHAIPNFFFTLTTIIVNFSLAFLLLNSADWVVANNFGLLNWFDSIPLVIHVLLGILLLDLIGAYLPHYIQHKIKFLWKIHLVHHSDHNVDTTTANRHHPFESIIRFIFTLIGVIVLGTSIGIVFLYQSISLVLSQFNHANIKLPSSIDKILSYIIVSPNMHKVHHHYVMPYTDSNYGNIFSVWDRLFGTHMNLKPSKIIYGVDSFFEKEENEKINSLLYRPFEKSRSPLKK
ncbi:MAG: sterol desaturase family protein [Flavobacteriaceae bacterium]|mgnify:FL=1|jgi:sterol desaturase/sphingolipid hydroxylase (fatty acid hydroxylase superfamily)|nr:sterol desaturase family protein [Flavobacteriaceae bacterium]MBT6169848.1 sterol desaturase family protein [Flavobacteriaceae bacterium]MBT6448881.1 sterol desaturase family protein [Flavobacteriaceae bacterium]